LEGWTKIHKTIVQWEWYGDSKMVHLFLHMLIKANHKERSWRGVKIKRGQLLTGLDALKRDTGISVQSLRTCIGRLKSTGEITSKSTNKFRIITICNYEKYQVDPTSKSTSQLTGDQQSTNNQLTAPKNTIDNKDKKERKNLYGESDDSPQPTDSKTQQGGNKHLKQSEGKQGGESSVAVEGGKSSSAGKSGESNSAPQSGGKPPSFEERHRRFITHFNEVKGYQTGTKGKFRGTHTKEKIIIIEPIFYFIKGYPRLDRLYHRIISFFDNDGVSNLHPRYTLLQQHQLFDRIKQIIGDRLLGFETLRIKKHYFAVYTLR